MNKQAYLRMMNIRNGFRQGMTKQAGWDDATKAWLQGGKLNDNFWQRMLNFILGLFGSKDMIGNYGKSLRTPTPGTPKTPVKPVAKGTGTPKTPVKPVAKGTGTPKTPVKPVAGNGATPPTPAKTPAAKTPAAKTPAAPAKTLELNLK